jgi:hypothetical protein
VPGRLPPLLLELLLLLLQGAFLLLLLPRLLLLARGCHDSRCVIPLRQRPAVSSDRRGADVSKCLLLLLPPGAAVLRVGRRATPCLVACC